METNERTVSRRVAVLGIASAGLLPAIANASPNVSADARLEALWKERTERYAIYKRASEAYSRASDQLPAWANHGPREVNYDMEKVGDVVGWPEIEVITRPYAPGAYRIIRPSEYDIENDYARARTLWGDNKADRLSYETRMAALRARQHQKAECYRTLRLDAMDQRIQRACNAVFSFEKKLNDLPTTRNVILASLIVDCFYEPKDAAISILRRSMADAPEYLRQDIHELLKQDDAANAEA